MGFSGKVIANPTSPVRLGPPSNTFYGIGTIVNEDPTMDVRMLYVPGGSAPTLADVLLKGSRVGSRADANQTQVQDVNLGSDPSWYWVAAIPFATAPSASVPARGEVIAPNAPADSVTANTFLTSSFVQPAVSSSVPGVAVVDTTWIAAWIISNPGAPIFVSGGGWYDVTVVDGTHITLTNLGAAGAIVTTTA